MTLKKSLALSVYQGKSVKLEKESRNVIWVCVVWHYKIGVFQAVQLVNRGSELLELKEI